MTDNLRDALAEHRGGLPPNAIRYVAGLGPLASNDAGFSVYRLVENHRGQRVANPVPVITDMTEEQCEHLWLQLGRALGRFKDEVTA